MNYKIENDEIRIYLAGRIDTSNVAEVEKEITDILSVFTFLSLCEQQTPELSSWLSEQQYLTVRSRPLLIQQEYWSFHQAFLN